MLALVVSADGGGVALGVIFLASLALVVALLYRRGGRIENKLGTIQIDATNAHASAATAREAAVVAATVVDEVRQSIGDPNGHGTTTDMLARLIEGQAALDHRIDYVERRAELRHEKLAATIVGIGGKVSDLSTRLDVLAPRE